MTDTILHRLFSVAERMPDRPAYATREESGSWKTVSYRDYATEVRAAAKSLIALGFEPGQTVCILGFNRPEWTILDLATMAVGGAPAGIYTACSAEEVQYIVHHAESPFVLVENDAQWQKIRSERARLPRLRHVITMRGAEIEARRSQPPPKPGASPSVPPEERLCIPWEEFLKKGESVPDSRLDERLAALEPQALATLIYTSGTTGPPKGVMLSHENLTWTASAAQKLTDLNEYDCNLSYLPLSHIAEQMFSIHLPITVGACVYFAESMERLPDNLKEVNPTVFFGVPRVWEKFQAGVAAKLKLATGVKKILVDFARSTGTRMAEVRSRGAEPDALLALRYRLATKLIFSKLKPALGLGRARICVSGAAPISKEVLDFMASLDVIVLEIYGQSEDSGPTSFNQPKRFRFGSVGPAFPGLEVKIAEDDEILVKGPNVFLGYYKDEEATASTLINGWLHSGDLGAFDEDGFLNITGRKKDIIVTAGGKNIAPKNLEASLKDNPLIGEAVVIGDRRKFLSCLITLDPDAAADFAKRNNLDEAALPTHETLLAEIQKAVDATNAKVAKVSQIKKFTVLSKPFSVETGELTPTLKIKRNVVAEHFHQDIESMYSE